MSDEKMANTPSFAELVTAMKALSVPEPKGIEKHISAIIVAAIIGIGAWLLTGLNAMQTSVTQVAATVTAIQKQVDDMSRRSDTDGADQAEMKTTVARIDQRVTQNEQRLSALESRRGAPNGQTRSAGDTPAGF